MRKLTIALFICLVTVMTSAQETTLGNCLRHSVEGNEVIFHCDKNAKVKIELCSGEVLKIQVAPEGNFSRKNPSFAVINEDLGWTGSVEVKEEPSAYEIFTASLRIRVNKSPFKLQIFDKYQKLLFSDYNDRGFVKQGTKVTAFKNLRGDEQFFGLGEKSGPLNRRGRNYKMWNSDQPCYGIPGLWRIQAQSRDHSAIYPTDWRPDGLHAGNL